jgi:hypothetical protein
MPAGMSKTQVNKLGKRLRDSGVISEADLELLQRLRPRTLTPLTRSPASFGTSWGSSPRLG